MPRPSVVSEGITRCLLKSCRCTHFKPRDWGSEGHRRRCVACASGAETGECLTCGHTEAQHNIKKKKKRGKPSPGRRHADIWEAAQHGNMPAVDRFLERGTAVDARDANGSSALMHAAYGNQPSVMRHLIEHGADMDLENRDAMTALDMAQAMDHADCVDVLLREIDRRSKRTRASKRTVEHTDVAVPSTVAAGRRGVEEEEEEHTARLESARARERTARARELSLARAEREAEALRRADNAERSLLAQEQAARARAEEEATLLRAEATRAREEAARARADALALAEEDVIARARAEAAARARGSEAARARTEDELARARDGEELARARADAAARARAMEAARARDKEEEEELRDMEATRARRRAMEKERALEEAVLEEMRAAREVAERQRHRATSTQTAPTAEVGLSTPAGDDVNVRGAVEEMTAVHREHMDELRSLMAQQRTHKPPQNAPSDSALWEDMAAAHRAHIAELRRVIDEQQRRNGVPDGIWEEMSEAHQQQVKDLRDLLRHTEELRERAVSANGSASQHVRELERRAALLERQLLQAESDLMEADADAAKRAGTSDHTERLSELLGNALDELNWLREQETAAREERDLIAGLKEDEEAKLAALERAVREDASNRAALELSVEDTQRHLEDRSASLAAAEEEINALRGQLIHAETEREVLRASLSEVVRASSTAYDEARLLRDAEEGTSSNATLLSGRPPYDPRGTPRFHDRSSSSPSPLRASAPPAWPEEGSSDLDSSPVVHRETLFSERRPGRPARPTAVAPTPPGGRWEHTNLSTDSHTDPSSRSPDRTFRQQAAPRAAPLTSGQTPFAVGSEGEALRTGPRELEAEETLMLYDSLEDEYLPKFAQSRRHDVDPNRTLPPRRILENARQSPSEHGEHKYEPSRGRPAWGAASNGRRHADHGPAQHGVVEGVEEDGGAYHQPGGGEREGARRGQRQHEPRWRLEEAEGRSYPRSGRARLAPAGGDEGEARNHEGDPRQDGLERARAQVGGSPAGQVRGGLSSIDPREEEEDEGARARAELREDLQRMLRDGGGSPHERPHARVVHGEVSDSTQPRHTPAPPVRPPSPVATASVVPRTEQRPRSVRDAEESPEQHRGAPAADFHRPPPSPHHTPATHQYSPAAEAPQRWAGAMERPDGDAAAAPPVYQGGASRRDPRPLDRPIPRSPRHDRDLSRSLSSYEQHENHGGPPGNTEEEARLHDVHDLHELHGEDSAGPGLASSAGHTARPAAHGREGASTDRQGAPAERRTPRDCAAPSRVAPDKSAEARKVSGRRGAFRATVRALAERSASASDVSGAGSVCGRF